ncbi:basic salivary proline-rich protein 3-like [Phacochoerus africanus]|uniref:basic salivary proline-rich protein 3-like n=1 Tax=Phacochoerus africanus TaxID=41426 RepID=UPI001FD972A6|nr:basic salivary proline-rich protein 3-like [Phacochoerus africanus]
MTRQAFPVGRRPGQGVPGLSSQMAGGDPALPSHGGGHGQLWPPSPRVPPSKGKCQGPEGAAQRTRYQRASGVWHTAGTHLLPDPLTPTDLSGVQSSAHLLPTHPHQITRSPGPSFPTPKTSEPGPGSSSTCSGGNPRHPVLGTPQPPTFPPSSLFLAAKEFLGPGVPSKDLGSPSALRGDTSFPQGTHCAHFRSQGLPGSGSGAPLPRSHLPLSPGRLVPPLGDPRGATPPPSSTLPAPLQRPKGSDPSELRPRD